MIHEIRNSLNGISTTLQLMERHLAISRLHEDPVLLAYVDGVRHELRRLKEILLEIQEVWTPDLRFVAIDMDRLISEVLRSEPLNSAGSRIRVETAIQKNCPPFNSDEKLLKRALANLIKNSLEAISDHGTLTLRGSVQNGTVAIEVIDSGSGVPEGIKPFTPYQTSKPTGMGLGLTIVRQIARTLRGEVSYSSGTEGTIFRLSLPQRCEDTRKDPAS